MKFIGLMGLERDRKKVTQILVDHHVKVFSEIEIVGHTHATLKQYGIWPTSGDIAAYSTLAFAIIPADQADEIMCEIEELNKKKPSEHPIHAFLVDVEKMV